MYEALIFILGTLISRNKSFDDLAVELAQDTEELINNIINDAWDGSVVSRYLKNELGANTINLDLYLENNPRGIDTSQIIEKFESLDKLQNDFNSSVEKLKSVILRNVPVDKSFIKEGSLAWTGVEHLVYIKSASWYSYDGDIVASNYKDRDDFVRDYSRKEDSTRVFGKSGNVILCYYDIDDKGNADYNNEKIKLIHSANIHPINDSADRLKYFLTKQYSLEDYYKHNKIYGYCDSLDLMVL